MKQVKMYIETKPSLTKYRSRCVRFPRLMAIVKDLNETWFSDIALVDKLENYNCVVKDLLVAIESLSKYLTVVYTKTKVLQKPQKLLKR